MSKVRNSVFGLALGDAIGYLAEFHTFVRAVNDFIDEDFTEPTDDTLLITDDTQMSLYLLNGFENAWESGKVYSENPELYIEEIANSFLLWLHDPDNNRAPGIACIQALKDLEKHLKDNPDSTDYLYGGRGQINSKGSGTVMRSPWIGLLHAQGFLSDSELEDFCHKQSAITHQHPTALHASYMCALMTSEIYKGNLVPGQLHDWAVDFVSRQSGPGWLDISSVLDAKKFLPEDYKDDELISFDPADAFGSAGTAENVLVAAINMIDFFHDDPIEVLRRCLFTSGDSDTIGAVAGGMLGAAYDEDIWKPIAHLVEEKYVFQLNDAVLYLENAS